MSVLFKVAGVGVALVALIAVSHVLLPVLLVVLLLGLIRRVWFGARWGGSCGGSGRSRYAMHRRGFGADWSDAIPTIDGEPWRQARAYAPRVGDVSPV